MNQQVVRQIIANVESAVLGKSAIVRLSVVTLLAGGHLLLEDAPGLGKTSLARALAKRALINSEYSPLPVMRLPNSES